MKHMGLSMNYEQLKAIIDVDDNIIPEVVEVQENEDRIHPNVPNIPNLNLSDHDLNPNDGGHNGGRHQDQNLNANNGDDENDDLNSYGSYQDNFDESEIQIVKDPHIDFEVLKEEKIRLKNLGRLLRDIEVEEFPSSFRDYAKQELIIKTSSDNKNDDQKDNSDGSQDDSHDENDESNERNISLRFEKLEMDQKEKNWFNNIHQELGGVGKKEAKGFIQKVTLEYEEENRRSADLYLKKPNGNNDDENYSHIGCEDSSHHENNEESDSLRCEELDMDEKCMEVEYIIHRVPPQVGEGAYSYLDKLVCNNKENYSVTDDEESNYYSCDSDNSDDEGFSVDIISDNHAICHEIYHENLNLDRLFDEYSTVESDGSEASELDINSRIRAKCDKIYRVHWDLFLKYSTVESDGIEDSEPESDGSEDSGSEPESDEIEDSEPESDGREDSEMESDGSEYSDSEPESDGSEASEPEYSVPLNSSGEIKHGDEMNSACKNPIIICSSSPDSVHGTSNADLNTSKIESDIYLTDDEFQQTWEFIDHKEVHSIPSQQPIKKRVLSFFGGRKTAAAADSEAEQETSLPAGRGASSTSGENGNDAVKIITMQPIEGKHK